MYYYNGLGVPQDLAAALSWYRKAAERNNAMAQYSIGIMYRNGKGVPQDYVLAHFWLNVAAAQESMVKADAAHFRDELAAKMTPAQIEEAQKMAREWKPK